MGNGDTNQAIAKSPSAPCPSGAPVNCCMLDLAHGQLLHHGMLAACGLCMRNCVSADKHRRFPAGRLQAGFPASLLQAGFLQAGCRSGVVTAHAAAVAAAGQQLPGLAGGLVETHGLLVVADNCLGWCQDPHVTTLSHCWLGRPVLLGWWRWCAAASGSMCCCRGGDTVLSLQAACAATSLGR